MYYVLCGINQTRHQKLKLINRLSVIVYLVNNLTRSENANDSWSYK